MSAYPVDAHAEGATEDVTVKGKKADEEGFTLWGFFYVINPFRHIPVVNTIYREMTSDEIKAPAKMIRGAIIGGPVGLAVTMVNSAIEDTTVKDLSGNTMAMFKGDSEGDSTTTDATRVSSGANSTAASQQSAATSSREFIPARLTAVSSVQAMPPSPMADETKNDETREATQSDQQPEAAIAAAEAAAPQGLVFMPLPVRQNAAPKPIGTAPSDRHFMAIDRSGLRTTAQAAAC